VGRMRTAERGRRGLLGLLGVGLLGLAAVGVAYPLWWQRRQEVVGAARVRVLETRSQADAGQQDCGAPSGPGVLRIPATGVVAPVEQGLAQGTLATAVGHLPSSPWPGQPGLAVVEAHDVGYFGANDQLRPGDLVSYQVGCAVATFEVLGHRIEHPGQPLPSLPAGRAGLVLISCWPPDALWFTSERLVVTAQLVGGTEGDALGQVATVASDALQGTADPPPGLPPGVPGGQPPVFGYVRAGTLRLAGQPSLAFRGSREPLAWLGAALDALAAYRQGTSEHAGWLSRLVRQAPPAIWGPDIPSGSLDAIETVEDGDQVQAVELVARFGADQVATFVVEPGSSGLQVVGGQLLAHQDAAAAVAARLGPLPTGSTKG
jgi:LPXTG-site transpeptidase (sortase) family protein